MEVERREEQQMVIDQGSTEASNSDRVVPSDDIDTNSDSCVICREAADVSNPTCMRPCLCKGTMALVHTECIEKWLTASGRRSCGICKFKYVVKTERQYGNTATAVIAWMKSLSREEVLLFSRNGLAALALVVTSVLTWLLAGFMVAKVLSWFYDFDLLQAFWFDGNYVNIRGVRSRLEYLQPCPIGPVHIVGGIIFDIVSRDFWASWYDWSSQNDLIVVKMVRVPPAEPEPQE